MRDLREGRTDGGLILTGASRARVPEAFEPVLAAVAGARPANAGLYLYGSVATGAAQVPNSDIDLIAVGWPPGDAGAVSRRLSQRYATLCRGVELAPASREDFAGEGDQEYGNRVFLRHYCVHWGGPVLDVGGPFRADTRAARGFNGDLARHARRWRRRLQQGDESLGPAVARKTLLAIAGLVSIYDHTWTTDREGAAQRWAELEPGDAAEVVELLRWARPRRISSGAAADAPALDEIAAALDGIVPRIVDRFAERIGMWPD